MKQTFKQATLDERFIKLSEGNSKLVPNKNTKFLIWNLPSKITCPYATAHCKQFCYAIKSETAYPTVLPSRLRHLERSRADDFTDRMIYTIESYLLKPSYQDAKKVIVRIHESGDFYNQAYATKWMRIAEHFKRNKKVVFMAYTKSVRYFTSADIPNNMIVRFSIWDDTNADDIRTAEGLSLPTYSAVDKFTTEPPQNRCRCKDCATCGKCWSKTKTIICEIH